MKVQTALFLLLWGGLARGGEAPKELIGDWKMSQGTGSSYRDARTGSHSAPNINNYVYRIEPNGGYQHAAMLSSSLYNCTMQILGFEIGALTVEGSKLTFEDQGATITSKDSCRKEWNYQKQGRLSKQTFTWRVERDSQGSTVLILRWPDGKQDRYYKQTAGQ